jgi:hypothetical protein
MPFVSKITAETKQHVISDYLAGKTVEGILKQHVISMSALRWLLKSRGITKRPAGNPKVVHHAVQAAKQHDVEIATKGLVPKQHDTSLPVQHATQTSPFVPAPVPAPSLRRASRDDLAGLGQVPPASKVSTPPLPRSRKAKAPAAASPPVSQYPAEFWANAICSPEAEEAKRWGKINTQAKLNALSLEDRMAYTEWKAAQESI